MNEKWILKDAERVLSNIFIFDHPWDMEPCSKEKTFKNKINWSEPFNDDEEWTFMLARFRFVETLAKAYEISGDFKYSDKAKSLIIDFINNTSIEKDNNLCRSLDTAIRSMHILKALKYIHLNNDEKKKIDNFLNMQMNYLKSFDSSFLSLSNWGAIGDCGLLSIILYFNEDCFSLYYDRLINNLNNSILDDGYQFEQSPLYHIEVLVSLLYLIEFSKEYHLKDDIKELEDIALKLSKIMILTSKNDLRIFIQGDSDDISIKDLITYAAYVLKSPKLKYFASKELPSYFSVTERKEYALLKEEKIERNNLSLIESGNFYLSNKGLVTHFRCGNFLSGHSHNDTLHFDVQYNNRDILVDSGRYTYRDCELRRKLKSAFSHNSIVLNDCDSLTPIDSWKYERTPQIFNKPIIEKDGICLVEGIDLSYQEKYGAAIKRSLIQIEDRYLIIVDYIYCNQKVKVDRYFHFDNNGKVELNKNSVKYYDNDFTSVLYLLDDDNFSLIKTHYSRCYNQIEEKTTLKAEAFNSNRINVSVLSFSENTTVKEVEVVQGTKELVINRARSFIFDDGQIIEVLLQSEFDNGGVSLVKGKSINGYGRIMIKRDDSLVRFF